LTCAPIKDNVVCSLELEGFNLFISSESGDNDLALVNATLSVATLALLVHRRDQATPSSTAEAVSAAVHDEDHRFVFFLLFLKHFFSSNNNAKFNSPSVGFVMRALRANVGRAHGLKTDGGALVSTLLDIGSLKLLLNLYYFADFFLFQQLWLSKLSRKARTNVGSLIEDAYVLQDTAVVADSHTIGRSTTASSSSSSSFWTAGDTTLYVNARVRSVAIDADLQLTGKVSFESHDVALNAALPGHARRAVTGEGFFLSFFDMLCDVFFIFLCLCVAAFGSMTLGNTTLRSRGALEGEAKLAHVALSATSKFVLLDNEDETNTVCAHLEVRLNCLAIATSR
jgi:hypothetical protein